VQLFITRKNIYRKATFVFPIYDKQEIK